MGNSQAMQAIEAERAKNQPQDGATPRTQKRSQSSITGMFAPMYITLPLAGGKNVVEGLQEILTSKPVLVIGGLTLAGRTHVANCAHQQLGGTLESANSIIRRAAEKRHLNMPQLLALAKTDQTVEAEIDLQLCRMIASGSQTVPLIIEGRLVGVMAAFLRFLGKKNVMSVYVSCSKQELALRWIRREFGEPAYSAIQSRLSPPVSSARSSVSAKASSSPTSPTSPTDISTLSQACDFLLKLVENDLPQNQRQEIRRGLLALERQLGEEMERHTKMYGNNEMNMSIYDVVADSAGSTSNQVWDRVSAILRRDEFPADWLPNKSASSSSSGSQHATMRRLSMYTNSM